jgi:FdhD protein
MDRDEPLDRVEEFDVVRFEDGSASPSRVAVATEVAFTVLANRHEIGTLMCTPRDLEVFCYGFLFTSGVIGAAEDVLSCRCDTTRWVGHVEVRDLPDLGLLGKRIQTPGCGKGVVYASAVEMASRLPISSGLRVPAAAVVEMVRSLERRSEIHRLTGGVHSAALSDTTGALGEVFDDIGRHNAVDKVIGHGLRQGVDFSTRVLVSSGRVSSEVLHKAKRADLAVVVSRSAPTHQSVLRARDMGVTLVGFARGRKFTVYSHPDRITP